MARLLMVTTIDNTLAGFLLPFARHFRERGWTVDGMANGASSRRECVETFDRTWEVGWSRNPLHFREFRACVRTLRETVARERYDLVHVHTPVAAFVARYALRDTRRRVGASVIYTAHGFHFHPRGRPSRNAVFLRLEKLAGRWTDWLVVINREDRQAALTHRIVPPDRLRYTPGIGIDTDHYSPARVTDGEVAAVRREFSIPYDAPVFLMAAGFTPEKRHDIAVAALALVRERYPAHMIFAGDGVRLDEARALAEGAGLRDCTHFPGVRRDVPGLMRASAATVLTSVREGLSRTMMESLSLQVPGIGSDIRGIRELLDDGCGMVAEPGDPRAFAEAMCYVIEHPAEASEMGRRGRAKAHERYGLSAVISAHEELYAEALAASRLERAASHGEVADGQARL